MDLPQECINDLSNDGFDWIILRPLFQGQKGSEGQIEKKNICLQYLHKKMCFKTPWKFLGKKYFVPLVNLDSVIFRSNSCPGNCHKYDSFNDVLPKQPK